MGTVYDEGAGMDMYVFLCQVDRQDGRPADKCARVLVGDDGENVVVRLAGDTADMVGREVYLTHTDAATLGEILRKLAASADEGQDDEMERMAGVVVLALVASVGSVLISVSGLVVALFG